MTPFEHLVIAFAAYFAGSLPLSIWARSHFPENMLKVRAFVSVFADVAKGAFVVTLAQRLGHEAAELAVIFVFIGHVYPSLRDYRRGNGMAVLLGGLTAFIPLIGLIAMSSWLFTYFVYRYKALSAVLSAIVTPIITVIIGLDTHLFAPATIVTIVVWRNRHALARLTEGTEQMVRWD